MIDMHSRARSAELLRHLAAGLITNDHYEDRQPSSSDPAIYQIFYHVGWPLYSDLYEHRLVGKEALTQEVKHGVARVILFLRSGLRYEWPPLTGVKELGWGVLSLLTLGWIGRRRYAAWKRLGDHDVWPFLRRADFEQARRTHVYLVGHCSEPSVPPFRVNP